MFRGLKKRLANSTASQSSATNGGSDSNYNSNNNSNSNYYYSFNTALNAAATTTANNTSSSSGPSTTTATFRLRKHKEPTYDVPLLKSMVTHLATFDACVEAADFLVESEKDPQDDRHSQIAVTDCHPPTHSFVL